MLRHFAQCDIILTHCTSAWCCRQLGWYKKKWKRPYLAILCIQPANSIAAFQVEHFPVPRRNERLYIIKRDSLKLSVSKERNQRYRTWLRINGKETRAQKTSRKGDIWSSGTYVKASIVQLKVKQAHQKGGYIKFEVRLSREAGNKDEGVALYWSEIEWQPWRAVKAEDRGKSGLFCGRWCSTPFSI